MPFSASCFLFPFLSRCSHDLHPALLFSIPYRFITLSYTSCFPFPSSSYCSPSLRLILFYFPLSPFIQSLADRLFLCRSLFSPPLICPFVWFDSSLNPEFPSLCIILSRVSISLLPLYFLPAFLSFRVIQLVFYFT